MSIDLVKKNKRIFNTLQFPPCTPSLYLRFPLVMDIITIVTHDLQICSIQALIIAYS